MVGLMYRASDDKNICYWILNWCWVTDSSHISATCIQLSQSQFSHQEHGMCRPTNTQAAFNEQWPLLLLRNRKTCLPSPNQLFSQLYIGKLIPEAKDFIAFITTNIVLRYKLPGSLNLVTFYVDVSNRFIVCSGKRPFFSLKLIFQLLEYQMNILSPFRGIWKVKNSMYFASLASTCLMIQNTIESQW